MKIEFLISTINRTNLNFLNLIFKNLDLKKLNILIINQCIDIEIPEIDSGSENIRIISIKEQGLSKSRNLAINNAKGDICIISDDDIIYEKNCTENIIKAYNEYDTYDILTFLRKGGKKRHRFKNHNSFSLLRVSSIRMTFKRESIVKNHIFFNPMFGLGSNKYIFGEEQIFLKDSLDKGLLIGEYPCVIVSHPNPYTWSKMELKNFIAYGVTVVKVLGMVKGLILLIWIVIKKIPKYYSKENIFKVLYYSIREAIRYNIKK